MTFRTSPLSPAEVAALEAAAQAEARQVAAVQPSGKASGWRRGRGPGSTPATVGATQARP